MPTPPTKPTILWVDDDPQWVSAMKKSLDWEFQVVPISSLSGFEKVLEEKPDIDVVVVDINFESAESDASRYAGLRVAEDLRTKRPDLPIIMTSAFMERLDQELTRSALAGGVQVFINKSYAGVSDVMGASVREVIANAKKRRATPTLRMEEAVSIVDFRRILIEEIDKYSVIKERTVSIPGAGNYELIKPLVGFKRDIEKRLAKFPFENSVFLMMKFRESNKELGAFIIENLSKAGLLGVRADQGDWNITKNVYNPIAVLYCCKFGIALFDEPENDQAYSPNVAYELGMMHYQNKDCLILRHSSLPAVPFDLVKDLYVTYDKDLQVRKIVESWIKQVASR